MLLKELCCVARLNSYLLGAFLDCNKYTTKTIIVIFRFNEAISARVQVSEDLGGPLLDTLQRQSLARAYFMITRDFCSLGTEFYQGFFEKQEANKHLR